MTSYTDKQILSLYRSAPLTMRGTAYVQSKTDLSLGEIESAMRRAIQQERQQEAVAVRDLQLILSEGE